MLEGAEIEVEEQEGPRPGGQIQMSTFCPIPVCPPDIDGDGVVAVPDLLTLLAAWGPCQ